ncbi:hypothetical protein Y032_0721g1822 [Ancylostoma ceylanicum]|uniref:Methyltransferase type 11 domain-containing protein n=1 Tax=Ancylostoma ceylanicum TaxID=53326 RepID=A0A016WGF8_9BILA|nr:hypothetical protein Y032_0721g1822 [Ancylostoma ceylanicum]
MVLLSANIDAVAPAPCELKLESGRYIRYVAPKDANPRKEVVFGGKFEEVNLPQRRKSSGNDAIDLTMCWEGVNSLCQLLDAIVETEMETDFFEGKSVLEGRAEHRNVAVLLSRGTNIVLIITQAYSYGVELELKVLDIEQFLRSEHYRAHPEIHVLQIGFATGLPSVYAYENGAAEIALHSPSKSSLQMYCKPTLRRNAIPENKCKFSSGDLSQMRKAIGGKRFDVILAAELLNRSEDEFEMVHQILDEALSHDGICLLSSPSHYFTVDSSLASFLDLVKRHRQFDVIERWSSPRTDVVQRKVRVATRLCN